jgi:hypothetical protein
MLPFYRQVLRANANKSKFQVMKLGRQAPTTTLNNWPREKKSVKDFTDAGKKCLERLQKQIDERLPAPKPERSLAVLLDPATKKFAEELLNEDTSLFNATRSLLKEKHREVYRVLHGKKSGGGAQRRQMKPLRRARKTWTRQWLTAVMMTVWLTFLLWQSRLL